MPYDFESARDARGQIRIGGVVTQVLRRPVRFAGAAQAGARLPGCVPASCGFPGCVRGNACRPADSHRAGYGGRAMSQSGTILETSFAAPPVPATMRAAVYRGKGRVVVEDVPVPSIGAGEVLIRVAACGICGTDIKKIEHGFVAAPQIFGHEVSGTVVAVGAGVTKWKLGDRVMSFHHVPCGACFYCERRLFSQCPGYKKVGLDGGFRSQWRRICAICARHAVGRRARDGGDSGRISVSTKPRSSSPSIRASRPWKRRAWPPERPCWSWGWGRLACF